MKILLLAAGFALALGVPDNLIINLIGMAIIGVVVFNLNDSDFQ